jgi:hypothetical protein
VHEDLVKAFPELGEPYRRLFEDWDNFQGQPPGQYIVFSDTYGTMLEVALTLPVETPGRTELLRRAFEFGESMLDASDDAVVSLAIDALAETLDVHPEGRELAETLGGRALRRWFDAYSTADWERSATEEIIDMWGVRQAISPLFPVTPTHELPGISYPSSSPVLDSLEVARSIPEGVVMLASYGTTRPYVVVRTADVGADPNALDALTERLAGLVGAVEPAGKLRAQFRQVPVGERVWNMHRGTERHARLWHEPWVHDSLGALREPILAVARGDAGELQASAWRASIGDFRRAVATFVATRLGRRR